MEPDSSDATTHATRARPRGLSTENEPLVAGDDNNDDATVLSATASTRSHRSLSSGPRPRVHDTSSHGAAVGARLLHALPPQLSQWLQSPPVVRTGTTRAAPAMTSAATSTDEAHSIALTLESTDLAAETARRAESGSADETTAGSRRRGASAASAAAAVVRVPVTLRVLPGSAPRAVAPRTRASSSSAALHEIGIDTDEALPALLSLLSPSESPVVPSIDAHDAGGNDGSSASPAASPRSTASSDDVSQHEELSTMEEFQTLFRRCHHSLPFVALFLVYFAYQHAMGIIVFIVGSVAIVGLDQRLRAQIALKENASRVYLGGIIAMSIVDTIAISTIDGEPNPFRHLVRKLEAPSDTSNGALIVDLVWLVLVNDFIIRLWSLGLKAFVASIKSEAVLFDCHRSRAGSAVSEDDADLEEGTRRKLSRSNVTFYRRKRKLYGIIELCSIFLRSLLAGVPWCSYYQLCASKFMADVFTFVYIFGKSFILGSQGRRLVQLVRSFVTLGLEHATYVTRDELAEAGEPDCSICYETMQTPVKLACTHMFCEDCVMEWFDRERSCPLCRAAITTARAEGELKPQFLDGSTSLFPQLF